MKHSTVTIWSKQAGDTIVEVLVAISIVSLVLVGAYSSVNHSTSSLADTQEHHQAVGLAQAQIESLRRNQGLAGGDCFGSDGTVASLDSGRNCYYTDGGISGCTSAAPYCYKITTTSQASVGDPSQTMVQTTYKIAITWTGVLSTQPEVDMYYRLPSANPNYVASAQVSGNPAIATSCSDPAAVSYPLCAAPSVPMPPTVPSPPVPKSYHYRKQFINVTTAIPARDIGSCVWDLGYKIAGVEVTRTDNCQPGDSFVVQFPPESPQYPYPLDCALSDGGIKKNSVTYVVTLSAFNKATNQTTYTTQSRTVPDCY